MVADAVRSPLEADRKVFLLEEASLLNDEAANALLKTLEEPPSHVVFVLASVAPDEADEQPQNVMVYLGAAMTFATAGAELVGIDDSTIQIAVQNRFSRDWLRNYYSKVIEDWSTWEWKEDPRDSYTYRQIAAIMGAPKQMSRDPNDKESVARASSTDATIAYAWVQSVKFSPDTEELAAVSTG